MTQQPTWHFPPRNGGVEYVQDPSSQFFGDEPVAKLVREAIQNSLDAGNSSLGVPVEVEFRAITLDTAEFGGEGLRRHIEACLEQAKTENVKEVYSRALDRLDGGRVECLTIADTGTHGLRDGRWESLVLREGSVSKDDGTASGSFGIGKNAVFNVSDLRAVIYSTRYIDLSGTVEKMQGKATLMAHTVEDDPRQHIGFYALDEMQPVLSRDIPPALRIADRGTRVTILGFNPRTGDWAGEVVRATLENFFVALHQRQLVVRVFPGGNEAVEINYETMDGLFGQNTAALADTYFYYRAIRESEPVNTVDISNMGSLELYVLMEDKAPRRVCLVNSNGMKITDSRDQKTNPIAPRGSNLWQDYAVVVVPSKKGDEWLRKTENVSHDALSAERFVEINDRTSARTAFERARREIRTEIEERVATRRDEETRNLRELAHLFPDEFSPETPGNLELQPRLMTQNVQRPRAARDEPAEEQPGDGDEPDREQSTQQRNRRNTRETPRPGPGQENTATRRPPLVQPRYVQVGPNTARVAFTLPSSGTGNLTVGLRPVGSEPSNEARVPVTSVTPIDSPSATVDVQQGAVKIEAPSGSRVILEITTAQSLDGLAVRLE